MLNTRERSIYLDQFKPPEGYTFDCAAGTTFTLDLVTLLMAPLSITLLDAENREDTFKDPILLLEALRENAGRLAVFCHDGYISVPAQSTLLYSYLEQMVIPVLPEKGNGLFHPKIWVMRFTAGDEPVFYRFLCLSRNLTFDRSWDTSLKLEGFLTDRKKGYGRNRPLADFISMLKTIPVHEIGSGAAGHLDTVLGEIRQVDFKPPQPFEQEISFYPSGFDGHRSQPKLPSFDRCLMISPFLSEVIVQQLAEKGSGNILISRPESLDSLPEKMISELEENTELFVMDDAAEISEEGLEDAAGKEKQAPFQGLHAKVYITESGWDAKVRSGSVNATSPAFDGTNVEFAVELAGKKSRIGIDNFLGDEKDRYSFYSMIVPYTRNGDDNGPAEDEKKVEALLDKTRRRIMSARFTGKVAENPNGSFSVVLKSGKPVEWEENVGITCRLLTLPPEESRSLKPGAEGPVFRSVSVQSLTVFFVFRVQVQVGSYESAESFVWMIPVSGIPQEERNRQILQSVIGDKSRFLRYLLLILSENTGELLTGGFMKAVSAVSDGDEPGDDLPLLEEMVKAFSRNSEKIRRIEKLVQDIGGTEEGKDLIPGEFRRIWAVFTEAAETEGSK